MSLMKRDNEAAWKYRIDYPVWASSVPLIHEQVQSQDLHPRHLHLPHFLQVLPPHRQRHPSHLGIVQSLASESTFRSRQKTDRKASIA